MSLLSRADLLRLLHERPQDNPSLMAEVFGFEFRPVELEVELPLTESSSREDNDPNIRTTGGIARIPPRYWSVAECEKLEQEENSELPEPTVDSQLISRSTKPFATARLRNRGQILNLWDSLLDNQTSARQPDLKQSVRYLSRCRPIDMLPKQRISALNGSVVLLLDFESRLAPAHDLMMQIKESLTGLMGAEYLTVFQKYGHIPDIWYASDGSSVNLASNITAGSHLLIISDFGALETGLPSVEWVELYKSLSRQQSKVDLLTLCPIEFREKSSIRVHALDPRSKAYRDRSDELALLAALSRSYLTRLSQLRALRLSISGASLHTELLVWNDRHLIERDTLYLRLREEWFEACAQYYRNLDPEIHSAISEVVESWQDSLGETARAAELLQQCLPDTPNPEDPRFTQLHSLGRQVKRHLENNAATLEFNHLRTLLPLLRKLDEKRYPGWIPLLSTAQTVAQMIPGERLPRGHIGLQSSTTSRKLKQQGSDLRLVEGEPSGLLNLGDQAYCEQTGRIIDGKLDGLLSQYDIFDRDRHWRLISMSKPRWAQRIWRNADGLFAAHEDGAVFQMMEASAERERSYWGLKHNPWAWAADAGVDEYGLWVELQVEDVGFRMRWIAAGTFLMGSPEDEPGRRENETQHEVTLTRGYWLAETACTQALWQVVTDKNPSHFKQQPDNPVEQVSWDDCQGFIKRLNKQFEGQLVLRLPTEAEWEYACRAGTQTAFSFGGKDGLDLSKANYSGKWDDFDHSGNTVSADRYASNPWGLFQMHGNVYEWCEDWFGDFESVSVVDPKGPQKGRRCVLRGGSWSYRGRNLRSAHRDKNSPSNRYDSIGLRLAGGADPQAGSLHALSADSLARSERQGSDDGQ